MVVPFVIAFVIAGCRQLIGIEDPAPACHGDAGAAPGAPACVVMADAAIDVTDAPDIDAPDAPIDAGPTIVTFMVGCGTTPTAAQLCQGAGYSGAGAVRGHGWWQCAGPGNRCLGGFVGLGCPDWCATNDCVNLPFCGAGHTVHEVDGTGLTVWNANDVETGVDCSSFSPGWTLRATCLP